MDEYSSLMDSERIWINTTPLQLDSIPQYWRNLNSKYWSFSHIDRPVLKLKWKPIFEIFLLYVGVYLSVTSQTRKNAEAPVVE